MHRQSHTHAYSEGDPQCACGCAQTQCTHCNVGTGMWLVIVMHRPRYLSIMVFARLSISSAHGERGQEGWAATGNNRNDIAANGRPASSRPPRDHILNVRCAKRLECLTVTGAPPSSDLRACAWVQARGTGLRCGGARYSGMGHLLYFFFELRHGEPLNFTLQPAGSHCSTRDACLMRLAHHLRLRVLCKAGGHHRRRCVLHGGSHV
jgi:hypothetical protein